MALTSSVRPVPTPRNFHHCLTEFLSRLTDRRPLGVAVSGGSDSLGLLYGLARITAPVKLVALTVDHGLRAGSADEARQVKSLCRSLGVCHETLVWEDEPPAAGLQAAARAARYRLLGSAAARLGLSAVLTAHTSDDQDETLEMRRARSPSELAPGLAGIPHATLFDSHMWVLRPLLEISRAEIRDFLNDAKVGWIEDPSNRDERFERVRVRAALKELPSGRCGAGGEPIAIARSGLARKAAALIAGHCALEPNGMIRMTRGPDADVHVVMAALEALIDLCGGAARPLDRRGKATLAGIASASISGAGKDSQAATLGRCLVQCRGTDLLIRRESRGVGKLDLAPGAVGVWDGRYQVQNLDRSSFLKVLGGGPEGIAPLFRRDLGPQSAFWENPDGVIGGFSCRRLAGRGSRILPIHEFPLAQALAALIKAERLPECPWAGWKDDLASVAAKAL